MSRRSIVSREQYEAVQDARARLGMLEHALRHLTREIMGGTARAPHAEVIVDHSPACAECGLRRGHPLHHPALLILDPAPSIADRRTA